MGIELRDQTSGERALIFDMDGVLIDSEPLWRRAEIQIFGDVGLVLKDADCFETQGLRIDEAMNPLSMLVTGLYGEVLPNQNGAPLRLMVPWKYGFKSIKSIASISFTEKEPPTSWNIANARE